MVNLIIAGRVIGVVFVVINKGLTGGNNFRQHWFYAQEISSHHLGAGFLLDFTEV